MTIEQIQAAINAKSLDPRQLINLLADYLQANPSGGGGGEATSLILTSPDETQWAVTVNNEGVLITTEI